MDASQIETHLREVVAGRLRELRQQREWSLTQLANQSGLSKAMLSKIENAQTTATLATLARIASVLSVPVTALFRGVDVEQDILHVKAGEGLTLRQDADSPHQRVELLGRMRFPHDACEPSQVTIEEDAEEFPLYQHGGTELIYVLAGSLAYTCGGMSVSLEPGDTLQFLGEVPHGPERIVSGPVRLLSVKIVN